MTALLVALGATLGAPARYLTDRWVTAHLRHPGRFPWGTVTVNVVGSLALGLVAAATVRGGGPAMALLGTGLCGALTTYSTFSYEAMVLLERDQWWRAMAYTLGSLALGLAAVSLGWWLAG